MLTGCHVIMMATSFSILWKIIEFHHLLLFISTFAVRHFFVILLFVIVHSNFFVLLFLCYQIRTFKKPPLWSFFFSKASLFLRVHSRDKYWRNWKRSTIKDLSRPARRRRRKFMNDQALWELLIKGSKKERELIGH